MIPRQLSNLLSPVAPPLPAIASDVADGLFRTPKSLPPKLLYDGRGSALFEQITSLPEYYPTRTEAAILSMHAEEICSRLGQNVTVSELGAGTATKTRILLRSLLQPNIDFHAVAESHRPIFDAVSAGDVERAARLSREHQAYFELKA